MAQFIAFNKAVEVNRRTVVTIVNAVNTRKEKRLQVLKDNGIDPERQEWFYQQDWLNAFKDIAVGFGDFNLFLIGKSIIDHAEFPPIKDLQEGLGSIDVAYHMNHRLHGEIMFNPENGSMAKGIGHYTLTEYDPEAKTAEMVCTNPYPSKFDEGIITQVTKKFRPGYGQVVVELDPTKETRTKGADSCTYKIRW